MKVRLHTFDLSTQSCIINKPIKKSESKDVAIEKEHGNDNPNANPILFDSKNKER